MKRRCERFTWIRFVHLALTSGVFASGFFAPKVVSAATVVLVRPAGANATAAEALVRMRGELVAGGFDVRVVDSPIELDALNALESLGTSPEFGGAAVAAIVAIRGESGHDLAQLWVIDRVTGKTVVRSVPSQPGLPRAAEILSVRALELLRASFLEVALSRRSATEPPPVVPAPAPPEVAKWTQAALQSQHEDPRWGIEVGGTVWASLDRIPASLAPLVRVDRVVRPAFLARISILGLGNTARVETPTGSADIGHQLALLDVVYRVKPTLRTQALITLGAGVLHVSARGQDTWPNQGISRGLWSGVADLGVGGRLAFNERFELALELHAQLAHPYPEIRSFDTVVAREGRPSLWSTLTLVTWM